MKSILDPTFRYTNSSNTDLRKTFARIRRQQRVHDRSQAAAAAAATSLVELAQRKARSSA